MPNSGDLARLSSSEKRALLAELLRAEISPAAPRPAFAADPKSRHDPFPLTDVQRAYWIGRSGTFGLGKVSCHAYLEFDVEGIDRGRLANSWLRLIERHDMLRCIVQSDGTPAYPQRDAEVRGRTHRPARRLRILPRPRAAKHTRFDVARGSAGGPLAVVRPAHNRVG